MADLTLLGSIRRLSCDYHIKFLWKPTNRHEYCAVCPLRLQHPGPGQKWTVKFRDSELEELGEQLPRYRPDSIAALRRVTRFSEPELKRLYRGFKAECPTGVVKEDTFKLIYAQFFPQGGKYQGIKTEAQQFRNALNHDTTRAYDIYDIS
ncbi:hypothetical protein MSG28_009597 [Choristoneura fumiferana]|uniref:Uncharacterized protein n=1 Tax=Choristoneura fumiferana TaxID=7141 RepID=A0ACC0JBY7_CHOFU|nr:hypothetical protein MSG28_009597 [Choristoneura fumiferana]